MDAAIFTALRPFAYHVSALAHLDRLRASRALESAERLLAHTAAPDLDAATRAAAIRDATTTLSTRRLKPLALQLAAHRIQLRDQRALDPAAIRFDPEWNLGRFVHHLNGLVSFWPGAADGPADMGRRDLERRRGESLVILRVPTLDLLNAPGQSVAQVSRCHSGAAHLRQGRKVPRGGSTFEPFDTFGAAPADVQELLFATTALLPTSTEWATAPGGPWTAL